MTRPYEYDLIVIGAGPAGEKGAAQAAYFGKKVVVVDRQPSGVGGASLNTGTHSKALRETALSFSGLRQRRSYGIDYSLNRHLDISRIMKREQAVVETERATITRNLERHHIETVWGSASLTDPHTVRVALKDGGTRDLSAEIILIATGSSPFHPAGVSFDHPRVHDSDSILRLEYLPRSLAIIGGGVIGSEYASVFSALGVKVTLVDCARAPAAFPGCRDRRAPARSSRTEQAALHLQYTGRKNQPPRRSGCASRSVPARCSTSRRPSSRPGGRAMCRGSGWRPWG